jgi:phage pi2 protein 07
VHKLEFCLLAIGNLVEDKDKKLSKQLIQLSNEAHYYYPEDEQEKWIHSDKLYKELFDEFEKFQKEKLIK